MESERLLDRAAEILDTESKHEKLAWLQHPLTNALQLKLRAKREWLHENWELGNFTHNTVEGTALKNAEIIGELNHIQDTLAEINNLYIEDEE